MARRWGIFFFSSRRRHTRCGRDWSSDVCSSDLGVDISLGPEMKSTGEVMGMDVDLGLAYAKSQMAAPPPLPKKGNVFVSVKDSDKESVIPVAREFVKLGFGIISTSGTADALAKAKIKVKKVFKLHESRPNVLDRV